MCCSQIYYGMRNGSPVNLYAQNDLHIHHLAQTHEHEPTIKLPLPPPPLLHVFTFKHPCISLLKSYGSPPSIIHTSVGIFKSMFAKKWASSYYVSTPHAFKQCVMCIYIYTHPSHLGIRDWREHWDPTPPPNWWVVTLSALDRFLMGILPSVNPTLRTKVLWTGFRATRRFQWCILLINYCCH